MLTHVLASRTEQVPFCIDNATLSSHPDEFALFQFGHEYAGSANTRTDHAPQTQRADEIASPARNAVMPNGNVAFRATPTAVLPAPL
jgi:hypothetical protein